MERREQERLLERFELRLFDLNVRGAGKHDGLRWQYHRVQPKPKTDSRIVAKMEKLA
jgi:hypothetical protein